MSPPTDAGPKELFQWLRTTEEEPVAIVRDVVKTAMWVVGIGVLLFAITGVWPPMVAVESGSMQPHMKKGDLVVVMDEGRLAGDGSYGDTGVVPYRAGRGSGYREFHSYGDVIVYRPNGDSGRTPIIHRARFWVRENENWYDRANEAYVGTADNCEELRNCPAPHAGFITKGDHNGVYDQVYELDGPISGPVKSSWIVGKAKLRIPWLGWIRLAI
ncbi:S26 family signal peptidase [Haladaptatus sp. DYF46]|uniref:S26 family signal peptidase n=1 Tax=Haladaptatus sp. DYF46 TaxID=2886041 RepID=UPI001E6506A7|nr:S26 family signal peptidase [Haladaptatus sp. DYF46]